MELQKRILTILTMALQNINSHQELVSELSKHQLAYLLLYKKKSPTSECAVEHINLALAKAQETPVLSADVSQVRDIHPQYSINSVPSLLVFENGNFKNTIKGCNDTQYYSSLFANTIFRTGKNGETKAQKRVTVYSTPTCSWCNTLKSYLREHQIRFTDVDVSKDQQQAEAMVRRSGQQGVPQTDINGQMIIGFDKAKINTLLGIQG